MTVIDRSNRLGNRVSGTTGTEWDRQWESRPSAQSGTPLIYKGSRSRCACSRVCGGKFTGPGPGDQWLTDEFESPVCLWLPAQP